MKQKGPFYGCRDDWQMPGPSGPRTKARAKAMRAPPFPERQKMLKPQLERVADLVAQSIVGTCDAIEEEYWYDTLGINLDEVYEILIDREVERCVECSWWIGDCDWSTDTGEIVCNECTEYEND